MIETIFSFLFSKAGAYVTGILGIVGVWFYAKNQGKKQEREKSLRMAAEEVAKVIEKTMLDREATREKFDRIRTDILNKHPDELRSDKASDSQDS